MTSESLTPIIAKVPGVQSNCCWQPLWAVRYSSQVKCRGILGRRGLVLLHTILSTSHTASNLGDTYPSRHRTTVTIYSINLTLPDPLTHGLITCSISTCTTKVWWVSIGCFMQTNPGKLIGVKYSFLQRHSIYKALHIKL